jgi:hypothetical protein
MIEFYLFIFKILQPNLNSSSSLWSACTKFDVETLFIHSHNYCFHSRKEAVRNLLLQRERQNVLSAVKETSL